MQRQEKISKGCDVHLTVSDSEVQLSVTAPSGNRAGDGSGGALSWLFGGSKRSHDQAGADAAQHDSSSGSSSSSNNSGGKGGADENPRPTTGA